MPQARHLVRVKAPPETVWELLLDKLERPHRYIESVLDSAILDRGENWMLREMTLPGLTVLRERIEVNEAARTLTFTLMEHPNFEGAVINRVRPTDSPETVELEFAMDWRPRPDRPFSEEDPGDLIRSAAEHIRDIAEALARAAGV
jgi:hypothetical protein